MKPVIHIKRVYETPNEKDGYRILIDRLWPRGIKKETAALNEWTKELAPSDALRKWFGHEPSLWVEFQKRYTAELQQNLALQEFINRIKMQKNITLIYSAKDTEHNNAIVLRRYLEQQLSS